MKIIFSRKGFDAGIGKVPSPIFPSGQMVSLPIPERSPHELAPTYAEIRCGDISLGPLVADLSRSTIKANALAHLDPDLSFGSVPRSPGWRPLFGQAGAAESHLQRHQVTTGDIFLFFGWFRQVVLLNGRYQYLPQAPDWHVLFGWLQIAERVAVAERAKIPLWAKQHPHAKAQPYHPRLDTLYLSSEQLSLPNHTRHQPGAGVFTQFQEGLRLTAVHAKRSIWQLPAWFQPHNKRTALSYHHKPERWHPHGESVFLQTVGRGQEFVLDSDDYPEAMEWLAEKLALA